LETLSSVACSAISLSPFAPASAIFGAVVFLVKTAKGVSEAYDLIEKLFDQLGDFAVRVVQYSKGTSPDLETKLVLVLKCLLEILAHSEKIIKDGRAKKFLKQLFLEKDETINALLEKLAKLQEGEQRQVNAENYAIQQDHLRRTILDWISSTNFPTQLSDFIARKEEGTGSWFLDAPKFKNWIQGSKQTLFCPGMPGAGKTMIAAIAINHLSRPTPNKANAVAYIFCNYKTQADQNATTLLAAVLRQLVQARPSIPEAVSRLHEYHSCRGTRPSLEEISTTLKTVVMDYSSVYLVVDALDECPDKDGTRGRLLAKISDLQKEAGSDLHLMVTSRFIPEIEEKFKEAPRLEVRASNEDVRKFVAGQMDRLPKFVRRDEELKDLVQDRIAQAVDGM